MSRHAYAFKVKIPTMPYDKRSFQKPYVHEKRGAQHYALALPLPQIPFQEQEIAFTNRKDIDGVRR